MHHAVASDLALAQDGVVHACCASLEELISIGRLHSSFTCMLSLPKGESHLLEVSGATSELERSNRVIVIRDITDRVRRIEAEKEVHVQVSGGKRLVCFLEQAGPAAAPRRPRPCIL